MDVKSSLWIYQYIIYGVARSTKNGHQIMVLFCSISSHSIWTDHNSDKICFLFQIIYLAQDARKHLLNDSYSHLDDQGFF